MPDVYAQAQAFRSAVLQRDSAALLRITNAYLPIFSQLKNELRLLTAQIQQAGPDVSKAWLLRQERFRSLLAQVARQIDFYAQGIVAPALTQEQRLLVNLAQEHAGQMISTQTRDIAAAFNRLPVGAVEQLVGAAGDGTPLNKLLKTYGRGIAGQVRDRLLEGVALGQGIGRVAKDVAQLLDRPRWEAARLVRTESLRAYRSAGNLAAQNAGMRFKQRLAAKSLRTCAACLSLDGKIYPIDAEPDFHVNCRCTWIFLPNKDAAPERQTASEWFAEQSAENQAKVLGFAGARAFREGLPLSAWVGLTRSRQWGLSRYQRSLADALASQ